VACALLQTGRLPLLLLLLLLAVSSSLALRYPSLPRLLARTPFRSLCSCRDLRSVLLLLLLRLPAAAVVNSPTLHSGPDPIALRMWQRLPNGGDHEMLETNGHTHRHLGENLFLNSHPRHSVAKPVHLLQVGWKIGKI